MVDCEQYENCKRLQVTFTWANCEVTSLSEDDPRLCVGLLPDLSGHVCSLPPVTNNSKTHSLFCDYFTGSNSSIAFWLFVHSGYPNRQHCNNPKISVMVCQADWLGIRIETLYPGISKTYPLHRCETKLIVFILQSRFILCMVASTNMRDQR